MAEKLTEAELNERAAFVFKGTVLKTKAAAAAGVPVTPRTAVVRVDEVVRAPALLERYAGKEITLQLEPGHKAKEGTTALFYAADLLFGEGVSAKAIGHTDIDQSEARAASAAPPAASAAPPELQERLAGADMIVTGKVVSVGVPKGAVGRAASGGGGRVSEHNAHWREAVVNVKQVDKGQPTVKQIVVRFPASNDVAWANAPKFEPGQEGVFILKKDAAEGSTRASFSVTEAPAQTYTALHPHDFQPAHNAEQIKTLIRDSGAKPTARRSSSRRKS
ncbi:MAG: hypothetical protein JOZ96_22740 [Acidobacteria bacterium]|nr:hypothetical protein [Acidobacteriota bacterium]